MTKKAKSYFELVQSLYLTRLEIIYSIEDLVGKSDSGYLQFKKIIALTISGVRLETFYGVVHNAVKVANAEIYIDFSEFSTSHLLAVLSAIS